MAAAILVVDDEPTILESLLMVLTDEGYAVHAAGDGAQALRALDAFAADLILTDVMTPELDGLGLLAALRERGDETPVILMSAAPIPPHAHDHTHRLPKPFDLDALLDLVQRILVA